MRPYYTDCRPLRWCPGEPGVHPDKSLRLLQAIQTLETNDTPRDTAEASSAELQALQNRVDLLISMVSQLCAHQLGAQRPQPTPFLLHGDGILWSADGLSAGAGRLELYLHEVLPEPLVLTGDLVISSEDQVDSLTLDLAAALREEHPPIGSIASLSWDLKDSELGDALTRLVFRHHRRSLARRQLPNNAPPSS